MKKSFQAQIVARLNRRFHNQTVWLTGALVSLAICSNARANIYATNLRLNGGTTNVSYSTTNYYLSYILNEPATLGVTVEILSGTNAIRSITLPSGTNGSALGTNLIVWDGLDANSNSLAPGTYTFRVTARAAGYLDWTQISEDSNAGNYVWEPRGIAINKNTNSPYYGRVFVGNAFPAPSQIVPGDKVGLLKLNADGTPAEEGEYSDGGWLWSGGDVSPWKVEVAEDDRVYVNDWSGNGLILSFDQTISSNSLRMVLRNDNWPSGGVNLSGPFVSRTPTNMQIWMADATVGGVGIRRWDLNTNGVIATNDLGTTIVQSGVVTNLDVYPYDVAVDRSNYIYTVQYRPTPPGDPTYRVFRFTPYTEGGPPEMFAEWKIGYTNDTMAGAAGIAVDPTATYVAVAFRGVVPLIGPAQFGSVRVFNATNGDPVVKPTPTQTLNHDYWDAAWDNVGNLYVVDNVDSVWRVYSPPGKNQATTVAAATLIVPSSGGRVAPIHTNAAYASGQFHCLLLGEADITYIIEASTNLQSWAAVATNTAPSTTRSITINAPLRASFYRALAGSSSPAAPRLSAPSFAAGQFQFLLNGTANATYVISSSADLQSWAPILTNTSANATRTIVVPATGSRNFYRAQLKP